MISIIKRSTTLEKAFIGVATLKSIDPSLDLGDGVTLEKYEKLVLETRIEIEQHNTAVALAQQTKQTIKEKEKAIDEMGRRILLGIGFKHGRKSDFYKMFADALRSARRRLTGNTAQSSTPTAPTPITSEENPA